MITVVDVTELVNAQNRVQGGIYTNNNVQNILVKYLINGMSFVVNLIV